MKILDILDDYDHYNCSALFMDDFDELEEELHELIDEIEEVNGIICNLSVVMENLNPDYCVYDMGMMDQLFFSCSPIELLKKIWLDHFNAWDEYISFDDVYGIYSGNCLEDFEELKMLDDTLTEVKCIASAMIDYINGEYFIGLDGVEGIEGETLRDFNYWLKDQRYEGLHEDDNEYSAAVMAQL